jgi:Zn-dependent protease
LYKEVSALGILNRLQSYWSWLTTDPLGFIVYTLYYAVAILASLVLHEVGHAYVADRCGDPTARMLGRITLNPLKHLDPVGTVLMVFAGFGWAKPVPVNPRNFSNYRRDDFLVSVAGITVNFTLFLLSLALAVGLNGLLWKPEVIAANGGAREFLASDGIGFAVLNSGLGANYQRFMLHPWVQYIQRFLLMFAYMNLALAIFNLIPFPPLDGFHIVNDILLGGRLRLNGQAFQIAQMVMMVVCFTGVLGNILGFLNNAVEDAVLNLFLLMVGKA